MRLSGKLKCTVYHLEDAASNVAGSLLTKDDVDDLLRVYAEKGEPVVYVPDDGWTFPDLSSTIPDVYVEVTYVHAAMSRQLMEHIVTFLAEAFVEHNFGDGQEIDMAREGYSHKGYDNYTPLELLNELCQVLGSTEDVAEFIKEEGDDVVDDGREGDSNV